jgi:uncharacterized membrane protein YsdA (DUF1294 family)
MTGLTTLYLVIITIINLITLIMFVSDKQAARAGRLRISEKRLLTLLLLGGVIGGMIGIIVVRHKSQHLIFRVVLVLGFVLHTALLAWLLGFAGG